MNELFSLLPAFYRCHLALNSDLEGDVRVPVKFVDAKRISKQKLFCQKGKKVFMRY